MLQLLKQREEDARQQAAHSAVILQRAEAERRRISDKYTRQRAQAKEMLEDFKRVRRVPPALSCLEVAISGFVAWAPRLYLSVGMRSSHRGRVLRPSMLRPQPTVINTLPVPTLMWCWLAGDCTVTAGDPRAISREHSAAGALPTAGVA